MNHRLIQVENLWFLLTFDVPILLTVLYNDCVKPKLLILTTLSSHSIIFSADRFPFKILCDVKCCMARVTWNDQKSKSVVVTDRLSLFAVGSVDLFVLEKFKYLKFIANTTVVGITHLRLLFDV